MYVVPTDELNFIFKSRFYDLRFDMDEVILSIYSLFNLFFVKNVWFFIINNIFGVTGIILSFMLSKLIVKNDTLGILVAIFVSTSAIYLEMSNSAYNVIITFNFMLITFISAILFQKKQKFNLLTIISLILMTSVRPEMGIISIPLFLLGLKVAEHKYIYFFQWLIVFGSFLIFNFTKFYKAYTEFNIFIGTLNISILSSILSGLSNIKILAYSFLPLFIILLLSYFFLHKIKNMNIIIYSLLCLYIVYLTVEFQSWYVVPFLILIPLLVYFIFKKFFFTKHKCNSHFLILSILLIVLTLFSVLYLNEYNTSYSYDSVDTQTDQIYYTFLGDVSNIIFDNNSIIIIPYQMEYEVGSIVNNSVQFKDKFSNLLIQDKFVERNIIDFNWFFDDSYFPIFEDQIANLQNSTTEKIYFMFNPYYIYSSDCKNCDSYIDYLFTNYNLTPRLIVDVLGIGSKRIIYEINAKNQTEEPITYIISMDNLSYYSAIKKRLILFFNNS